MITKNIYILYPAGYYGTYINWAISKSDINKAAQTVDNPLNTSNSKKLGGAGTAHKHKKIPTHQGVIHHYMWMMYNKPTDYRIYSINLGTENQSGLLNTEFFIASIIASDPNSVFINIHNDNDEDIANFGSINALFKWPTHIEIRKAYDIMGSSEELYKFDPFDCNNIESRNLIAEHKTMLFRTQVPIDRKKLSNWVRRHCNFYNARHRYQPHEVNEETYVNPSTYIDDYESRIFELSIKDVVSDKFPEFLNEFMKQSNVSTEYNTTHAINFHPEFVEAQTNLQWFTAIEEWRKTGIANNYINSHKCLQGFVMNELFEKNPDLLKLNWKNMSLNSLLAQKIKRKDSIYRMVNLYSKEREKN